MVLFVEGKVTEYGYLLSKEQIGQWNSTKTTRRKKGQVCAETRVKSLKQHLQVFKQHKERNSTQYWKIYDDNNVQIIKTKALTAVLFLFEIKGASNVSEKLQQLINLNPNQDQVDTKILEVSRRIRDLESRIERAKDATFNSGRSKDVENHMEQSHLESILIAELQNPSQST